MTSSGSSFPSGMPSGLPSLNQQKCLVSVNWAQGMQIYHEEFKGFKSTEGEEEEAKHFVWCDQATRDRDQEESQEKKANSLRGGDKRGGRLWGIGWQILIKVEVIWWRHLSCTKSLLYLPSMHPSEAKGPEPIPHASWVSGCTVSAMISSCSGPIGGVIDWGLVNLSTFWNIS